MNRRRRDLATSEWFHITNRGADRQDIFSLPGDQPLFEHIVGESCGRWGVSVHAYAWMTNHYHLILRAPDQSLSEVMQRIGKRYGAAYNDRTDRTGPVFDHRFHSVPIADDAQLLQAARYVHRNPLAFTSPRSLASYAGSSLGAYLGRRPEPEWLDTRRLGSLIDPSTYLDRLVTTKPEDRAWTFGQPTTPTTTEDIERAILRVTGCDAGTSRSPQRTLAITLATELRTNNVMELASHFGVGPAAIRKAARTGRLRGLEDAEFRQLRVAVLRELDRRLHMYPVPM